MKKEKNTYTAIIEQIFFSHYKKGLRGFDFEREEIIKHGKSLGVNLPKNLGDLIYTFRYRASLPHSIKSLCDESETWIIRPVGKGKYRFVLVPNRPIIPNDNMVFIKIPDATPGIVVKHAFSDEQALLAKVRYNRLIDIFLGITCYSLQNHLRTTVPNMGQVETDEIYVGIDKKGIQYVVPVQAKSGSDKLNVVQIEQDYGVCIHKFSSLFCRPVAAKSLKDNIIVLFEFGQDDSGVGIVAEKHYKLVNPEDISESDLISYAKSI